MSKPKKSPQRKSQTNVDFFLKDLQQLSKLQTFSKHKKHVLSEYPFDHQLLSASPLYRQSRKLYLSLGGIYSAKVCSTMRSLSAQDLFKDEIEFSPSFTELTWFKDYAHDVSDPQAELEALSRFNEISLFHEQNHRVIWRLLPPAPSEERDLSRYLNFAESLVVTLDLALGDQLGKKISPVFERMKVIYRTGGTDQWSKKPKAEYRKYLLVLLCSTYLLLEMVNPEDILKAVDYIFPGQKKMNQLAVTRGLDLSELFFRITNPEWQKRYWQDASKKLKGMHVKSKEEPHCMPEDPLDLEEEFQIANRVFDFYGL